MNTADEQFLDHIRRMPEIDMHKQIVMPLLRAMGATHVRYVHGSFERGKDIIFVMKDSYGDDEVQVCQVKNEPLSGKAGASSNTIGVLHQLQQARSISVLHPATMLQAIPEAVVLLTSHPIPDKDVAGAGKFLEDLKSQRCKVVGPEKLVDLIRRFLPELYEEITAPGDSLMKALSAYLSRHHEAKVFNIASDVSFEKIFVDLGAASRRGFLEQIMQSDKPKVWDLSGRSLPKQLLADIISFQRALGEDLAPLAILTAAERAKSRSEIEVNRADFSGLVAALKMRLSHQSLTNVKRTEDLARSIEGICRIRDFVEYVLQFVKLPPVVLESQRVDRDRGICIPALDPEALLCMMDNVCIVGGAGAGKTSIARTVAKRAVEKGVKCIFFPCTRITSKAQSLRKELGSFLASLTGKSRSTAASRLVREAQVVILDGCDEAATFLTDLGDDIFKAVFKNRFSFEVIGEVRGTPVIPTALCNLVSYDAKSSAISFRGPISSFDARWLATCNEGSPFATAFSDAFRQFRQEYPQVILTTRDPGPLDLPRNFVEIELLPFNELQLHDFFRRWCEAKSIPTTELFEVLAANAQLRMVCQTPMVATIVAALYENKCDLPHSKTEVYQSRFNLLLGQWDALRGVTSRNRIRQRDKEMLLAQLAYRVHALHERRFTKGHLKGIWEEGFAEHYPSLSIEDVIWELTVVNNVIYPNDGDAYTLGHLSYQEYLTAQAMVTGQHSKKLLAEFRDPWWRQVLIFFAGLSGDIGQFLEQVQGRYGTGGSLVEEMICEARFTGRAVRDAITDMANEDWGTEEHGTDEYFGRAAEPD